MLRTEAITKDALALLMALMNYPLFDNFGLVGGTALALQYGHRLSDDLDFLLIKKPIFSSCNGTW